MTAQSIISHYNHLNGNAVSGAKLRDLHQEIQTFLDRNGSGPYAKALSSIRQRLAGAIKNVKSNEVVVARVKVMDLSEVKETPAQKKKVAKVLREFKKKKLKTPQEKKQAVAIALREAGVPKPKPAPEVKKKETTPKALAGFTSADQAPQASVDTFTIPGEIGKFIGQIQPFKYQIVLAGETHSSKSELAKQIANAFSAADKKVGYIDWEQGGTTSIHTQQGFERNASPENRKKIMVSGELPKSLEAVKALAKSFDVVILDSGTKLNQVTNEWIDTLRNDEPDTIWVIVMQQNTKGGTRGGTAAEFDAPVVIKTYRPDPSDFRKNYAVMEKNRGNKTGIEYLISEKKIAKETEKQAA